MHTGLLAADAWKRERKKPRLKKERKKDVNQKRERGRDPLPTFKVQKKSEN